MPTSKRRRILAAIGAMLFAGGAGMSLLFAVAAVWLLVEGTEPAWIVLAATAALAVLGLGIVKLTGVRLGDALNL
ncbi:hypothetical protein [Microbacterium sp. Marseille-Q6965]|uniref:hypothetical protein n=1 Tax=Microbacterium sp. Marseille-Q6965 TaxID=2965072 RepID=UPI0021B7A471|nr:hypothetical protein [Microbacterium sp. Marseille-Q6965]